MSLTPKERDELFNALTWDAKHFGQTLADTAYARGLAVTNKDDGSTKPIPITATPVIIDAEELARRQQLAQRISSATLKMSRAVLASEGRKELVIHGLSPLERSLQALVWTAGRLHCRLPEARSRRAPESAPPPRDRSARSTI